MVLVRTLRREDIPRVAELTARAFGGQAHDPAYQQAYAMTELAYAHCPMMPLDLGYVAEIDGLVVAKWQLLDLKVSVGQATLRTIGAHAVVIDPAFNHMGIAQQMVSAGREAILAREYALMIGMAQRGSLYAAMGGVTINADYLWSTDALSLPARCDADFALTTDADVAHITDIYNQSTQARGFGMVRSVEQWPWLTRRAPEVHLSADGYLGLRMSEDAVEVREVGMTHPRFARDALAYLGVLARERGVRRVFGHLPMDHMLVEHSRAFGAQINVTLPKRAGVMGGIANVGSFMAAIEPELHRRHRASAFADRSLALRLTLDDGAHTLHLSGKGPHVVHAALSLSNGQWLQWVFGYRSVGALLLETGHSLHDEALAMLDAILPPSHPFIWHTDRF